MKTSLSPTLVLLWALSAVQAAPADVAAVPAPPGVTISSFGANGSGCPPGSTFHSLNKDKSQITVIYSKFDASDGPKVPVSETRKNCQLTLGLTIPPGYKALVSSVDHFGYYQLDSKVEAEHNSIYYFQGQLNQASVTTTKTGPVPGSFFKIENNVDLKVPSESACSRTSEKIILNINTSLRVNNDKNKSGFGYIGNDASNVDLSLGHNFNVQWSTC